MQKQIPSYAAALMLALLLPIGACTKVENIPSPTPLVIKEGVKLSYTPKNGKELSELRDKELVPLIQKKIIKIQIRMYILKNFIKTVNGILMILIYKAKTNKQTNKQINK